MKKIISILAVAAILCTSVVLAADFTDTSSHWARNEISILSDKGIVNGFGDGTFNPEGEVTRAQYLKMVMQAVGIPIVDFRAGECLDANETDWFGPYLQSALDKGLIPKSMIVGYKAVVEIERDENGAAIGSFVHYDGAFNGNVSITREEAAYLTMALSQYTLNANTMKKFAFIGMDVSSGLDEYTFNDESNISAWALSSVRLAAANEIINGMENGNFEPLGTTTRAQAAVMINRLLDKIG